MGGSAWFPMRNNNVANQLGVMVSHLDEKYAIQMINRLASPSLNYPSFFCLLARTTLYHL